MTFISRVLFVISMIVSAQVSAKMTEAPPHLDQNSPEIHPAIVTHYRTLLELNDLSYTIAKMSDPGSEKLLRYFSNKSMQLLDLLDNAGWRVKTIYGKTGKDNQDPDAAGIVAHHRTQKVIAIVFHGSRNGAIFGNKGEGDWGSNQDSAVVPAKTLGLAFPGGVHKGFANNFQSAEDSLFEALKNIFDSMSFEDRFKTSIFVSGHSKGAGVASIALPRVRQLYVEEYHAIPEIFGILISAPRAFQASTAAWVDSEIGLKHIIRVNAYGDLVTQVPFKSWGFRSIGTLALDFKANIDARAIANYGKTVSFWNIVPLLHYMIGYRSDIEGAVFDPNIVMQAPELVEGIQAGKRHLESKGPQEVAPIVDLTASVLSGAEEVREARKAANHAEEQAALKKRPSFVDGFFIVPPPAAGEEPKVHAPRPKARGWSGFTSWVRSIF